MPRRLPHEEHRLDPVDGDAPPVDSAPNIPPAEATLREALALVDASRTTVVDLEPGESFVMLNLSAAAVLGAPHRYERHSLVSVKPERGGWVEVVTDRSVFRCAPTYCGVYRFRCEHDYSRGGPCRNCGTPLFKPGVCMACGRPLVGPDAHDPAHCEDALR